MFYFSQHPLILYDPLKKNKPQLSMDITKRFKIRDLALSNALLMYDYQIKDRDRPDIMAEKYYGNPRLDWIFFLTNSIWDPYFQWPLTQYKFESYIKQKYGSIANAQSQVHHYEQIVESRKEFISNFDGSLINIPEKTLIVDLETYQSLPSNERKLLTDYDHEEVENNKRRLIKILDKQYVPLMMREMKGIFNE